MATWQAAVDSGSDFFVEFRIRRHDGEYRPFDTRAVRLRDAQGRTVRWVGSNTDITERKQAEERQKKLEAELQQAQKLESLGVLAGGIAHDFNNLLMGVLGNAEIAVLELPPESPARRELKNITTAARRLTPAAVTPCRIAGQSQNKTGNSGGSCVSPTTARSLRTMPSPRYPARRPRFGPPARWLPL